RSVRLKASTTKARLYLNHRTGKSLVITNARGTARSFAARCLCRGVVSRKLPVENPAGTTRVYRGFPIASRLARLAALVIVIGQELICQRLVGVDLEGGLQ